LTCELSQYNNIYVQTPKLLQRNYAMLHLRSTIVILGHKKLQKVVYTLYSR